MDIEVVIFDLDGTLLDSLTDISESANSVLQKHGFPTHSYDDYRFFVGNGVQTLIERIVPTDQRHDRAAVEQLVSEMLDTYRENWKNRSTLYAGIPEMLRGLIEREIQIAVLSNKPQASTERCVKHFLADFPLYPAFGQSADRPHKPNPAGALEIASLLSVDPGSCMFVGDTAIDIETGLAAGMCPIGVSWGFRDRAELHQAGALAVIDRPSELLPVLEQGACRELEE